jgi:hypothetical protein
VLVFAVNTAWFELLAVCESKELGELSEDSAVWKVESALLSVPSAEMLAVTAWVWLSMSDCCGASVAATSSETSELTLMTDPPDAAALVLPATETIGCATTLEVELLVLLVVMFAARTSEVL